MDARQVAKTAALARLKLSDDELTALAKQLTDLLEYVAILDEVATDDVEPMAHAVELSNIFRDDESRPSLPRNEALANAPLSDGRFFLVPPILGES